MCDFRSSPFNGRNGGGMDYVRSRTHPHPSPPLEGEGALGHPLRERAPCTLHLDAVGGVAGDMFIAAMLDAFPDLREPMLSAIRAAGLPSEVTCEVVEHRDHALTGLRFVVDDPHDQAHRRAHLQSLDHAHDETPFAQIRDYLRASGLATAMAERAIAIFSLLAEVEGEIHGRSPRR